MEKTLTLNELINRLTYAVNACPEMGDKPVAFIDWDDMTTAFTEGVHDVIRDRNYNIEKVVLG